MIKEGKQERRGGERNEWGGIAPSGGEKDERRGRRGRREEILQENELRTENKAERDEQGGEGRLCETVETLDVEWSDERRTRRKERRGGRRREERRQEGSEKGNKTVGR